MKKNGLAILVVLIIAAGSCIRLANLGVQDFDDDELIHYYAAQSIMEGKGPLLPSGSNYFRGIDVTRLVGLSLRYVHDPELATRLPSAFFGVLNLVIFAWVAWRLGGPWASAWATFFLAVHPEAVYQSRMTRFYTYQLCFGLIAVYTGWFAVAKVERGPFEFRQKWFWSAVTAVLFFLAVRVQVTTLSVAAGWFFFLSLIGCQELYMQGRAALHKSVAFQVTAIVVTFALFLLLLRSDILKWAMSLARFVPIWEEGTPSSILFYYHSLSESFPLVVSLVPVVFLTVAIQDSRLGIYLFTWFAVPLFLHSFIFAWKGDRFILLAVPALFLATSIAAATAGRGGYQMIRSRLEGWGYRSTTSGPLAGCVIVLVSLFIIITMPAFNNARKVPGIDKKREDWRLIGEIAKSLSKGEEIPLGSSIPLSGLYYWDRVDFTVGRDFAESAIQSENGKDRVDAAIGSDTNLDFYVGVPVITTPEKIQSRYAKSGSVLIGIDNDRWLYGNIDSNLQKVLTSEAEELCQGRCGTLRLYHWVFKSSP